MKIVYTKHAKDKLKIAESIKFKINKRLINISLNKISLSNKVEMFRLIEKLDKHHDLCVIIKQEDKIIKVITFFPTQKGRYESEILQRR